jgi:hypothetical protein
MTGVPLLLIDGYALPDIVRCVLFLALGCAIIRWRRARHCLSGVLIDDSRSGGL